MTVNITISGATAAEAMAEFEDLAAAFFAGRAASATEARVIEAEKDQADRVADAEQRLQDVMAASSRAVADAKTDLVQTTQDANAAVAAAANAANSANSANAAAAAERAQQRADYLAALDRLESPDAR